MALTSYDLSHLNSAQQAALNSYTQQWQAASNAGDKAGMEAAHAAAEALRNSAGYSSNEDGSYQGAYNNVVDSVIPSYQDLLKQVNTTVQANNAKAQQMAQEQWTFNRAEAQKNRNWQEYMSNTAHQREVQDLLNAGLNPVLSAGGNGAAVTSGATASGSSANPDYSANSIIGNFVNGLVSSAASLATSQVSAKSAAQVARIYADMDYKIAEEFPTMGKVLGGVANDLKNIIYGYLGDKSGKLPEGYEDDPIRSLLYGLTGGLFFNGKG